MRYILCAICCLFVLSCTERGLVFSEERVILEDNWSYAQPISFDIPVSDTTTLYQLLLDVKYSTDFDYENLYVNVTTTFPDKSEVTDVLSLELADDRGVWNGKCSSTECVAPILLRNDFRFKQLGKYSINFDQYSRENNLSGLKAFELKLLEAKTSK
jgi:gliding motility-associated lipoprotein GldH